MCDPGRHAPGPYRHRGETHGPAHRGAGAEADGRRAAVSGASHTQVRDQYSRVGSAVGRDRSAEAVDIPPAVIPLAIDENGRRSLDTIRDAALQIPLYTVGELVCGDGFPVGPRVDTGGRGVALETLLLEVVLIREQSIVHDPELLGAAERGDGLSRLRGHLRMWMDLAEWEVAKHVSEGIAIPAQMRDGEFHRAGIRPYEVASYEYIGGRT